MKFQSFLFLHYTSSIKNKNCSGENIIIEDVMQKNMEVYDDLKVISFEVQIQISCAWI